MRKKLKYTTEEVKEIYKKHGLVICDGEAYTGCRSKIKCLCVCGNECDVSLTQISWGVSSCYECGRKRTLDAYMHTIEEAKQFFIKNGCILLEHEYKNSSVPMSCICKCGKECKLTLAQVKQGTHCQECHVIKIKLASSHTLEEAKEIFKSFGLTLLTTEYTNATVKMHCICECGEECKLSIHDIQHGVRCSDCKSLRIRNTHVFTLEEAKQIFKENECTLLIEEYIDSRTLMPYICKCERECKTTLDRMKTGSHCMECGIKKRKYSLDEIRQIFKDSNCTLLATEYETHTPLAYICECGKEHKITVSNFLNGSRCKECGYNKNRGQNSPVWIEDREYVKLRSEISKKCYHMLKACFKYTKESKNQSSEEYLGYTRNDLRAHITNHPNWNNMKHQKWSLDHVFPIKAFIEHNILDFKIINALDNLRPITPSENSSKNCKYNKDEFYSYLSNKYGEEFVKNIQQKYNLDC